MKKYQCPCCGYYTQLVEDVSEPLHLFEICEVCFWQYDTVAHDKPNIIIGPNHVSLNQAKENYKKFGVCEPEHKNLVREPLEEEFPENN